MFITSRRYPLSSVIDEIDSLYRGGDITNKIIPPSTKTLKINKL